MKRNWIILLTVLAAATVFIVSNEMGKREQAQPPSSNTAAGALPDTAPVKGSPAPAFELQALDDDSVTYRVGGPRDKLLLINFWASWCWPCEKEAPDLVKAYDLYEGKLDLYAVNATDNDKVRNARLFVEEQGFTKFPVLTDSEGTAGKAYKVFNYPTSFLVDRNGYIVERIEGMMTLEQIEQMVESYL